MKLLLRLSGLYALLASLCGTAEGQVPVPKVASVDIKHVGPATVSDELIRANIRVKPGDPYFRSAVDDDVRSLYATGLFYNIRVSEERAENGGVALTYTLQGKPRLTDIKFQGNKKLKDSKLKKKVTSKVGEPLDERKLFTDSQELQKLYQKSGYPDSQVKYVLNIDENAGRGTATFEITESPKIKIVKVEFAGAQAFPEKKLRKEVKTRKHWMFSWLTGSGVFKDEQFEDDRERLAAFYREKGYIDFEIKDVEFVKPTPQTMVVRFHVYEGRRYKVGAVTFKGTTMFPTNEVGRYLKLKPGAVFTPKDLSKDTEAVEDFYGAKGYIDVAQPGNLRVTRVPNTDTGTMDLNYQVEEGQKSYIEKIEIRGNTKTKDKVIRRELAVSPGEVFDMVRVKISKKRLEGLQYFEKVDARPEPIDPPIAGRKNLVVGVEEKNTGNLTFGAGFSSVDSVVGFVEVSQGNFDLFHPPTFTGGGQKFRLRVQLGTERQDYVATFVEPWFLGRKLALAIELYHRKLSFQSENDLYDEDRTGARMSLTRALGSDFLIGSVFYNIEDIGILLNEPAFEVPPEIVEQKGYSLISKLGASIAYDTRNSTFLPDAGQRTELSGEVAGGPLGGDKEFYKLEMRSAWYVRGLFKGHVIEAIGRTGVAGGMGGQDVPFYERYYLGGMRDLKGFRYRDVSPRDLQTNATYRVVSDEPIGGNTYWFGTVEYSLPIVEQEKGVGVRFALFYDIGAVAPGSYTYTSGFSDDWGLGLRLNLPIGPLRLDYGIPMRHDRFSSDAGRFQFGVGYTREF